MDRERGPIASLPAAKNRQAAKELRNTRKAQIDTGRMMVGQRLKK